MRCAEASQQRQEAEDQAKTRKQQFVSTAVQNLFFVVVVVAFVLGLINSFVSEKNHKQVIEHKNCRDIDR